MSLHHQDEVSLEDVLKVAGVALLATLFWIAFLS